MNLLEQNPYAAPTEPLTRPTLDDRELELQAARRIRIATATLWPAALANYLFLLVRFSPTAQALGRNPTAAEAFQYQAMGAIGCAALLLIPVILWLQGARLLGWVAAVLHNILGGQTDRAGWIRATYQGLNGLVMAAMLGTMVWLAFVVMLISRPSSFGFWVTFTLLGHICPAIFYVPILVRWYRYRRENRRRATLMN